MTHLNHKSPLAPASFPEMPSIAGVRLATFTAGINTGTDSGITAGTDSGFTAATDSGIRAGTNSVINSGISAAIDSGISAAIDSGTNADTTAGTDSGFTAATDSGISAAIDSGTNADTTAGTDSGITTGTDSCITAGTEADRNAATNAGTNAGTNTNTNTNTNTDTNAGTQVEAKPDLFCASLAAGTNVAATFTRSKCPSAAVEWCQNLIRENTSARAVVCNSGNANAFTGAAGTKSTELMAQIVANALAVQEHEVYVASTGVIGEPLPNEKLQRALPQLVNQLAVPSTSAWERAANAICTTDTFPKGASTRINKSRAQIAGIAKGSGMIAPDMATLLAFVFTDMAVEPTILQNCLSLAVKRSFNRITIDSDTSTSDTVLLFATGAANDDKIASSSDARLPLFQDALNQVLTDLAQQVVRDGEGATKFVEVTVRGAQSNQAAHNIARAIAESPLVSTALAAEDANWGRIVMAVGKAGEKADRDRLAIWIGDELVAQHGAVHPNYSERTATEHLQQDEVRILVDVGIANGSETIWTCDLTHGYIAINAGYRT